MAERNDQQSSSQSGLLFGDLLNDETSAHVESVEVPADDSLAKILADVKGSPVCGACRAGCRSLLAKGRRSPT